MTGPDPPPITRYPHSPSVQTLSPSFVHPRFFPKPESYNFLCHSAWTLTDFLTVIDIFLSLGILVSSSLYHFFFFFLATLHGMQDLSSSTRDWIRTPAGRAQSPNLWTTREVPSCLFQIPHSWAAPPHKNTTGHLLLAGLRPGASQNNPQHAGWLAPPLQAESASQASPENCSWDVAGLRGLP